MFKVENLSKITSMATMNSQLSFIIFEHAIMSQCGSATPEEMLKNLKETGEIPKFPFFYNDRNENYVKQLEVFRRSATTQILHFEEAKREFGEKEFFINDTELEETHVKGLSDIMEATIAALLVDSQNFSLT
jgi:hypothetical protein